MSRALYYQMRTMRILANSSFRSIGPALVQRNSKESTAAQRQRWPHDRFAGRDSASRARSGSPAACGTLPDLRLEAGKMHRMAQRLISGSEWEHGGRRFGSIGIVARFHW